MVSTTVRRTERSGYPGVLAVNNLSLDNSSLWLVSPTILPASSVVSAANPSTADSLGTKSLGRFSVLPTIRSGIISEMRQTWSLSLSKWPFWTQCHSVKVTLFGKVLWTSSHPTLLAFPAFMQLLTISGLFKSGLFNIMKFISTVTLFYFAGKERKVL